MIAETSTDEALPRARVSKAERITSTLTIELPKRFPRVRALVWFNEDKRGMEPNG
jgi:hypothetical protein